VGARPAADRHSALGLAFLPSVAPASCREEVLESQATTAMAWKRLALVRLVNFAENPEETGDSAARVDRRGA
jgi:hypothetical protein